MLRGPSTPWDWDRYPVPKKGLNQYRACEKLWMEVGDQDRVITAA